MSVRSHSCRRSRRINEQAAEVPVKSMWPRQANVFARERLHSLLDVYRDRPVTWISGIPGAGKTTLLAGYLEQTRQTALWLQIGADDTDPMVFFTRLTEAARELHPHEALNLPAMRSDHLTQLDRFVRRFFRVLYTALGRDVVIVLDDYHLIDPGVRLHQAFAEAVSGIPAGSRWIIVSRSDPPAEYARLLANSLLGRVADHDLRLTLAEAERLVKERQPAARRNAARIHELAHGWIAGIVLLLNDLPDDRDLAEAVAGDSTMFHYFAHNVFNKLEERSRRVLMHIAFLPYVDIALAEAMTADRLAISVLAAIHRRGLFVDRYGREPITYQLHPLFRLYMQEQARLMLPPEEWRRIVQQTADCLCERELYSDAIPLLAMLEQWDVVVGMLLELAPRVYREGRRVALRTWIMALPRHKLAQHPWLMYWQSVCNTNLQEANAKRDLEQALSAFRQHNDRFGMVVTTTALIEIDAVVWGNYARLGPWIAILEQVLAEGVPFPSLDHEAAARAALFSAAVIHQPTRPELASWAEKMLDLLRSNLSSDTQLVVARALFLYSPISGQTTLVRPTEVATIAAVADTAVSPMNRIWYLARLAFASIVTKPKQEVRALFQQARDLADKYDITMLDSTVGLSAAWAADSFCDAEWFNREFDRGQALIDPTKPIAAAFLKHMEAFSHYLRGDLHAACETEEYAAMFFKAAGAFAGAGIVLQTLAFLYYEVDRPADALAALSESEQIGGRGPRSNYLSDWLLAAHDLSVGNTAAAKARLLESLPLGAQFNLEIFLRPITHPVVARVCAFALRENIHPALVKRVITKQGIRPPARNIKKWPWRIRIYVLSGLRVEIDDNPVAFVGRTPRKPMQLLKAICAEGGENVPSHRLAEQLWPDAEGDAAKSTFEMTLSRLRRILLRDSVCLEDGKLRLNADLVWLDLWDFTTTALNSLRELRANPGPERIGQLADDLLDLYQGHLLSGDGDEAWLVAARNRTKHLFLRVVYELGNAWQATGRWSEAASFYERVLAIEFSEEDLYQRLMACYVENGQHAAALAVYRRLQQMLTLLFSTVPSAETVRLLQKVEGL